jgi:hypothetical protein
MGGLSNDQTGAGVSVPSPRVATWHPELTAMADRAMERRDQESVIGAIQSARYSAGC